MCLSTVYRDHQEKTAVFAEEAANVSFDGEGVSVQTLFGERTTLSGYSIGEVSLMNHYVVLHKIERTISDAQRALTANQTLASVLPHLIQRNAELAEDLGHWIAKSADDACLAATIRMQKAQALMNEISAHLTSAAESIGGAEDQGQHRNHQHARFQPHDHPHSRPHRN